MAVGKEYLLVGRMFVVVIVALDGRSVGGTADKRVDLAVGRSIVCCV